MPHDHLAPAALIERLAEALDLAQNHPEQFAAQAAAEDMPAGQALPWFLAGCVCDWLADANNGDGFAGTEGARTAEVATALAIAGLPLPLPVRLEPRLALQLVDLCQATGQSLEAAVVGLVASHIDQAVAAAYGRLQLPPPPSWAGPERTPQPSGTNLGEDIS